MGGANMGAACGMAVAVSACEAGGVTGAAISAAGAADTGGRDDAAASVTAGGGDAAEWIGA